MGEWGTGKVKQYINIYMKILRITELKHVCFSAFEFSGGKIGLFFEALACFANKLNFLSKVCTCTSFVSSALVPGEIKEQNKGSNFRLCLLQFVLYL